jgi:hypothetical protein
VDASALRDPDAKKLAAVLRDTYLPEKNEDANKGKRNVRQSNACLF